MAPGCWGRKRLPLPSQEDLRAMFDYDPDVGTLRWKARSGMRPQWLRRWPGALAGTRDSAGYVEVRIARQSYLAHRLIWKWMFDEEPSDIDHVDLDRSNNRLRNLRRCAHVENTRNSPGWRKKTLPKGVFYRPCSGRFRAIIGVNRKNKSLGTFDTVEEAQAAYNSAARAYFGSFARVS